MTGANSGIGQAVALALAPRRRRRRRGRCLPAGERPRRSSGGQPLRGECLCARANVAREDEGPGNVQTMIREFGTIPTSSSTTPDSKDAPIDRMSLADWQFVLDVNLTGQFLCQRKPSASSSGAESARTSRARRARSSA